ncbi:hypothetical protein OGAPHI_002626 [Ogataea philodendri]|uniref:Uncharacterized protein n=1 Tax=Ogataea philodendri TaxID=1378263 RepID=A0A9P8T8C7_9ASCO|nr:uncharacterized protein OGAPHI_002626 [Ogataea philodendri]KAH3668871.1 hypothetical protein OGAPHI_002626 [Ogataea philodendri]
MTGGNVPNGSVPAYDLTYGENDSAGVAIEEVSSTRVGKSLSKYLATAISRFQLHTVKSRRTLSCSSSSLYEVNSLKFCNTDSCSGRN